MSMGLSRILTIGLAVCAVLLCVSKAEGSLRCYSPVVGSAVILDGKVVQAERFSPEGRTGAPGVGDLVQVRPVWIRLVDDEDLRLTSADRAWGRVFTSGSPPRPVAVLVDEQCAENPFEEFTPSERRGLQGVCLRYCPSDARDWLQGIDPARCALTLGRKATTLPPTLQHLVIRDEDHIKNLKALTELRTLIVEGPLRLPASVVGSLTELRALRVKLDGPSTAELANLTKLRHLDLSGSYQCPDYDFLKSLPELRILSLARAGVSDLSCLKSLRKLVELDVSFTHIESLRPLGGSLELRKVDATYSQLELLPDEVLPRLKLIEAVGTGISDAEAARFKGRNRSCVLHCRWLSPLLHTVRNATSLRVRSGGYCGCGRRDSEDLYETADAAEIDDFIDGLELVEIRPSRQGFFGACGCCGSHTIEFREGDTLLAEVSIHHGHKLRWVDWPSDASLTKEGVAFLQEWMKARGIDIKPPSRR